MKLLFLLLVPAIAGAQPLFLPPTNQSAAVYDAQGQQFNVYPSPSGSVVDGPGNERFDVIKKSNGGNVVYDQHGARVLESYPNSLDPASHRPTAP